MTPGQSSQTAAAPGWSACIRAAATAGILVGLVAGSWIVLTNPVHGFTARFAIIAICIVAYGGLLGLALAPLIRMVAGALARLRGAAENRAPNLTAIGVALVSAAATLRYTAIVSKDLSNGYSITEVITMKPYTAIAPILFLVFAAIALRSGGERLRSRVLALSIAVAVLIISALPSTSISLPNDPEQTRIEAGRATSIAAAEPSTRVALIGFDGLDPKLLDTFVEAGMMPNFKKFLGESAYAELRTFPEGLSPPIWTSFATGVAQTDHGIHDFFVRDLSGSGVDLSAIRYYPRGLGTVAIFDRLISSGLVAERPITPADRQAAALWNLLTDAGKRVSVIDWMATWPAETVSGTLVSDRSFFVANQGKLSVVADDVRRAGLPLRLLSTESMQSGALCSPEPECLDHLPAIPPDAVVDVSDTPRFHREENVYYTKAAERALADGNWDVAIYYSHLPDFINHRLVPSELLNMYELVFETPNEVLSRDVYLDVDRTLGQVLALIPEDVVVILVSDHGVEIEGRGDALVVNHHLGPNGVLIVRSSAERPKAVLPSDPHILSIAPTVLAAAGVPVPEYMPGRVLTGILEAEFGNDAQLRKIDLKRGPSADAARSVMTEGIEGSSRERLRALGYVD